MIERKGFGTKLTDAVIVVGLGFFALITFLPYLHVLAGTFASTEDLTRSGFLLFPKKFSLNALIYILTTKTFSLALSNSVKITVVGTVINVVMTTVMAYPLAQRRLLFRSQLMSALLFTMVFNAGMIPNYMNIRSLGLMDTLGALVIPGAISTYNLIIVKNYFQSLPDELRESATLDGCSEPMILLKIIVPLSMPVLATITLFYAVGHWNSYMSAILYLRDSSKWPLQVILRNIVILSQMDMGSEDGNVLTYNIPQKAFKYATIFVATTPILLLYPFLQNYFIKGVMLGSVKG